MKKLLIVITAIFLIAAAWYVFKDTKITAPVTDSDNLNDHLRQAPVNRIDLSGIRPDTLLVPAEDVMSPDIEAAEMLNSFSSTQAIHFGNYIIVMEFLTNNVAAYTQGGDFVRRIGSSEVSQATSITASSDSLYIYDYGNKGVHLYNTELDYQRSFPFDAPYYTQGSIKVNNTHVAYQREDASGFRIGESGANKLLFIAESDQPNAPVAELFPRIVPFGKHPGGFNNLLFSMNGRSDIVASYPALPYLFVYRNFDQHRNLLLVSPKFEEIENPGLTPFQPVMGEAVRISNLMDNIYLRNNGDILLFSFGELHYIRLQRSGDYEYRRSYVLVRGDNGMEVKSINSIDESRTRPGTFYIVSSGKLIILELPE